jgi:zinc protease
MADYIPEIHQLTLPNGMNLLGVEYDRAPWVSLTYMVKRGSETDPPGKAGVADWAAEFLTLGTARRDQRQLAQEIESRGASLQARGGWDATLVSLEGLAEDFPELMNLLAEVVQTPSFPAEEFPLLRDRRQAELAHLMDNPREVASLRFLRLFFGEAPYGHPVSGELRTISSLTLADLQDYYHRELTPQTSSLVIVGMVDFARMAEEARRHWETWSGGGPASPAYLTGTEKVCSPGIYLWDRPELSQSEIRMGHLGLPRLHPDYFPLMLANYVLGEGGFSSRLMTRIRSDLGLTYGIRSSFLFRRAPGPFLISTFTPAANTALAVKEIQGVMQEVAAQGVHAQELAEAQSYFVGHFPLGLETPRNISSKVISMDLYDLGLDYLQNYCDQILGVTLNAAAQAARDHLRPENLVTMVMGPAAQVADSLKALGPVQIIDEI